MKRIDIIVDSFDEYKETEKELLHMEFPSKYKEIEIFCREINSTFFYSPVRTEDGKFIYTKLSES